jgi:hypothetical protein
MAWMIAPDPRPGQPPPGLDVRAYAFDPAATEAFVRLWVALHGAPGGIPPDPAALRAQLAPDLAIPRRPGAAHRHFLASRGDAAVGHVSALVNPDLRDHDGMPVGAIGFYECIDDDAVAAALLRSAIAWLRTAGGVRRIWGPLNFDIWHGYRFMTRGLAEPPFAGEPRNRSWYPTHFERAGFRVRKRWHSLSLDDGGQLRGLLARHQEPYRRLRAAGYRFDPLALDRPADVELLYRAECAAFSGFLGYTPLPLEEFARLLSSFARLVDRHFVTLVKDERDQLAGFALAYSDVAGGRRAILHSIGAMPQERARRHGCGSAIFFHALGELLQAGQGPIVFALLADDSPARRLLGAALDTAQREYTLYELT